MRLRFPQLDLIRLGNSQLSKVILVGGLGQDLGMELARLKRLQGLIFLVLASFGALGVIYGTNWIVPDKFKGLGLLLSESLLGLVCLWFIYVTRSYSEKYLGRPRLHWKTLLGVATGLYVFWNDYGWFHFYGHGLSNGVWSVILLLAIGFGEEFLSRGFVFGYLRRYGVWWATIISSVSFGLLHISNCGKMQGAMVTSIQVAMASGFGAIMVGAMLLSGSIWIPVLLHAFQDSTIYFSKTRDVAPALDRGSWWDLWPNFAGAALYFLIGLGLVYISGAWREDRRPHGYVMRKLVKFAEYLGLVEDEPTLRN